jgi:hypothetical protein
MRLYPPSARGGCMVRFRGAGPTYLHNFEPATHGWRLMAGDMATRERQV